MSYDYIDLDDSEVSKALEFGRLLIMHVVDSVLQLGRRRGVLREGLEPDIKESLIDWYHDDPNTIRLLYKYFKPYKYGAELLLERMGFGREQFRRLSNERVSKKEMLSVLIYGIAEDLIDLDGMALDGFISESYNSILKKLK